MLHRHARATVLYATHASPSDPNFYDDEFKERLALLIAREKPALVLDLHASHPYRPYDVDFGTMGGASLLGNRQWLDALADSLRREGIRNFSQDRFGASKNRTVTRFVAAAGVPAVQLEINSTWLLPPCSADGCAELDGLQPQRFAQMLEGLSRFIGAADAALGAPTCPGRPPE